MLYNEIDQFIFDSLLFLENSPCTNGMIRDYCKCHNIKKVIIFDPDKILELIKDGYIVCYADHLNHGKRYKPHFYFMSDCKPYVYFYINFKDILRKEICNYLLDRLN